MSVLDKHVTLGGIGLEVVMLRSILSEALSLNRRRPLLLLDLSSGVIALHLTVTILLISLALEHMLLAQQMRCWLVYHVQALPPKVLTFLLGQANCCLYGSKA